MSSRRIFRRFAPQTNACMTRYFIFLATLGTYAALLGISCSKPSPSPTPLVGTWKLLKGTTIAGKDTTVVDYTQGQEMIKIISPTHFAFLRHDLNHGKDSTAVYSAGGGRATINGHKYTEYLDYFNDRVWEGNAFEFEYTINGDTLTTKGIEKIEKAGVDHVNMEMFVRVR